MTDSCVSESLPAPAQLHSVAAPSTCSQPTLCKDSVILRHRFCLPAALFPLSPHLCLPLPLFLGLQPASQGVKEEAAEMPGLRLNQGPLRQAVCSELPALLSPATHVPYHTLYKAEGASDPII